MTIALQLQSLKLTLRVELLSRSTFRRFRKRLRASERFRRAGARVDHRYRDARMPSTVAALRSRERVRFGSDGYAKAA